MTTHKPNRLQRQLAKLDKLPRFMQGAARNAVLRRVVPFTGTAKLEFTQLKPEGVRIDLRNHRSVQNHIRGVHASAMNLLAETATGMAVGMHVRDDCLPLAKELKMQFKKRATGGLHAVACLTPAQIALMQEQDKGEVQVQVTVTDDAGVEPVQCEFVWAWIPAKPQSGASASISKATS
jgi:acyl-coenzyme A thioesterase PaaI-like protein